MFFLLRQTLADLGTLYLLMLGAVAILVMLWRRKAFGAGVRALRLAGFSAGTGWYLTKAAPRRMKTAGEPAEASREKRTMANKIIISCAITGSIHTPTMSDALPITPDQIATQAIDAAKAGAAILHLHARDPKDGRPSSDAAVFMQFLPRIKQATTRW